MSPSATCAAFHIRTSDVKEVLMFYVSLAKIFYLEPERHGWVQPQSTSQQLLLYFKQKPSVVFKLNLKMFVTVF